MNNIKTLFFNRFKSLSMLTISILFSLILLMIRMKLMHNFFYSFLVWNLFLAIIPYAITTYITSRPNISKLVLFFNFCFWLLFLPNAPYIITDLIHLRLSPTNTIWLDILVVTSFAFNGLIIYFLSLIDMEKALKKHFSEKIAFFSILSALFLSGFGIYLGRVLRFNSWDILKHPHTLIPQILSIFISPMQHQTAWVLTLGFGTFLSVGYLLFKALKRINS